MVLASDRTPESATLRDYLLVARRRKWIILQAVILVPAAAIAFSLTQQKLYTASSEEVVPLVVEVETAVLPPRPLVL